MDIKVIDMDHGSWVLNKENGQSVFVPAHLEDDFLEMLRKLIGGTYDSGKLLCRDEVSAL